MISLRPPYRELVAIKGPRSEFPYVAQGALRVQPMVGHGGKRCVAALTRGFARTTATNLGNEVVAQRRASIFPTAPRLFQAADRLPGGVAQA